METILSNELMNCGLRPTVLLIGSDERLLDYYHYPPTDKKLQKYVFLNLCARKWGLVASVGRYVYFGGVPADLKKSMKASATISANVFKKHIISCDKGSAHYTCLFTQL